jgi:hypothetical protein
VPFPPLSVPIYRLEKLLSIVGNMASSEDAFIYAESVNVTSRETLMLPKFPVTKSVGDLKAAIAEQVGEGCKPEDITVTYGSQELTDSTKPLSTYHIRNGDTVDYLYFTVAELEKELAQTILPTMVQMGTEKPREVISEMYFRDFNGVSFALKSVSVDATVAEMRRKLAKERGLQYKDEVSYRFLWNGKQLEDGKKLLDYGTKAQLEKCNIQIVSRVRGGEA